MHFDTMPDVLHTAVHTYNTNLLQSGEGYKLQTNHGLNDCVAVEYCLMTFEKARSVIGNAGLRVAPLSDGAATSVHNGQWH